MRKTEWEMVRKEFFPRWDSAGEWKLRKFADLNGGQGICLSNRKTIKILKSYAGEDLLFLLIHEICHAVTHEGHGNKWFARMTAAAKRARAIGMKALASRLLEEVKEYRSNSPVVTAGFVYERVVDVVRDCKEISFKGLVVGVGREFGFSRRAFLSKYRRLRSVYDKALAEKQQRARERQKWLARRNAQPETL